MVPTLVEIFCVLVVSKSYRILRCIHSVQNSGAIGCPNQSIGAILFVCQYAYFVSFFVLTKAFEAKLVTTKFINLIDNKFNPCMCVYVGIFL